ncbi:replication initiation protein [Tomitella cavernea]|uniref:Primase C-terminal 1 domain-containing protein n=1 Tax=Tomitella cavernea TaxID=1387982 RepID=A0ABP9D4E7_9ACTN
MRSPTTEQWDQMWLPLWPYASDELWKGIYRTNRTDALGRRYIEANPQAISNLLVVDIDHPDALLRAICDRHGWLPNAVVENRANGHAHAVWALLEAITRTEYARRKPLAYAAAVTEGLRRSVDGDKAYSGLMTKNPVHDDWEASWLTDRLYSLDELAGNLTEAGVMPPASWQRTRRRNPVGLGRNCTIFETARTWAYREMRHHFGDPAGLYTAISTHVHLLNAEFSEALPVNEAECIAASIHRWITTQSRMWADGPAVYEATFSTIQSARGHKSGQARRAASAIREVLQ